MLHLRSSYIQCSPRKRTSTAKLLALRNIQSLHIETVWDEKKKTLNIFSLGLHTVHIELPILLSTRFASCSYLPGKHCLISPSIATRSHVEPEQLLAKDMNICTNARYFQSDETTEIVWPCHSLTHSLNPVFEVLLWMSKIPIQNFFMLFLLLMLT